MKLSTLTSKALYELVLIALVNGIFFFLFSEIDFLEWLVEQTEAHEEWELDEIIPLFFTLSISFMLFALSRWRETQQLYKSAHYLSINDPLTGIYNRRYFSEVLRQEVSNSKRQQLPFTVVLMDIDNFKAINDSLGHDVGDEALSLFSKLLLRETRESDVVARWGGEEFTLLCRNTDEADAQFIVDKLLSVFRHELRIKDRQITVTMGVTTSRGGESLEALMKRADDNLYDGKQHGKNTAVYS